MLQDNFDELCEAREHIPLAQYPINNLMNKKVKHQVKKNEICFFTFSKGQKKSQQSDFSFFTFSEKSNGK